MSSILRTFLLTAFWYLLAPAVPAQDRDPGTGTVDPLIRLYGRRSPALWQPGTPHTYLVKAGPMTDLKKQAPATARILRQLAPGYFIIATMDSGDCAPLTQWMAPAGDEWKLSPALLPDTGKPPIPPDAVTRLCVTVTDPLIFKARLSGLREAVTILEEYVPGRQLVVSCRYGDFTAQLLPLPELVFADLNRGRPKVEQAVGDLDLSTNAVILAHREFPGITGQGLVVSIREDRFDTADIDLRGRVLNTSLASTLFSTHATIMATIIGGAGNSFYSGQGVATRSSLSSFNFNSLLPDPDAAYSGYGISVQNHSYGSAIENYYGNEAAAHDISAHNNPSLLHVFSAGNSGDHGATSGIYEGIPGMADLTGNYKMAKNILTVGSTDSFGHVLALSSKGPAYDGRVKPELVAFGQDGSSGAAAIVSGTGLLLQQAYKDGHNGTLPPSDLLKAILLNSADDAGPPGIDFLTGYGSVNAYRALAGMNEKKYFTGSLGAGGMDSFTLSIPVNTRGLKVTLAWNDPAAAPNAFIALVNDLDLELADPATGGQWLPWTLNSYPSPDSLRAPAVRKRDSLNNTEQVSLADPPAGDYTIRIRGTGVTVGPQAYSVAYDWDSAGTFQWAYPVSGANIFPGAVNLLRWETMFRGSGLLEYSIDSGRHWTSIDAAADLSKNYYPWLAPDTAATGLLRISSGGQVFLSEAFSIGNPPGLSVGFDCLDSVFLYWHSLQGVSGYQLYALGDTALQPQAVVKDTFAILDKARHPSLYYAVAPILAYDVPGIKSHTVNYTTQGVGCYISTFTADMASLSSALLTMTLGSRYRVTSIQFQKLLSGGYRPLSPAEPASDLPFTLTDNALLPGVNSYRVAIMLEDGRIIYSEKEVIYYTGAADYLVYPNPVGGQGVLHILTAGPSGAVLEVFNVPGQKIYEGQLQDNPATIDVSRWAKGLYFFMIGKNGKTGKFIIY